MSIMPVRPFFEKFVEKRYMIMIYFKTFILIPTCWHPVLSPNGWGAIGLSGSPSGPSDLLTGYPGALSSDLPVFRSLRSLTGCVTRSDAGHFQISGHSPGHR